MENKDPIICKCISKIPGCMSGRATTMTARACFLKRNLDLLLYQDKTGELSVSGIADHKSMDKIWNLTDKIYTRIPDGERPVPTVSYDILYGGKTLSLFNLLCDQAEEKKEFYNMNAHHCNGNPFDHRIKNGIFLTRNEHREFHSGARQAMIQGRANFLSYVKSLHIPRLYSKYVNSDSSVLFETRDYAWMRDSVIREVCGSKRAYDRLRKAIKENTKNQTEKEKKYLVIL